MRLRLTTSASLIALLATPAFAQTSPPTDGDAIVVTAQKREQNLQDVPIAITAVSGQALRDQRIRTIDEIGTQVSNTQIYQDKGGSQPNWTVKRRSKGNPDRRRRGTPFSDNMMLVC
ncbi:hypothetical protein [Sphingobium xenophagum]|uniref:hypothetical protein n=1 Tax=Sphingobium xenophagum TaxID=121428 RepID=UPI00241E35AF|nr:hypothetical protein [Sphingobium xenophagum]